MLAAALSGNEGAGINLKYHKRQHCMYRETRKKENHAVDTAKNSKSLKGKEFLEHLWKKKDFARGHLHTAFNYALSVVHLSLI